MQIYLFLNFVRSHPQIMHACFIYFITTIRVQQRNQVKIAFKTKKIGTFSSPFADSQLKYCS